MVPGRGLRAESLLAPEAGPSEGLPPPVLPSALGCSAPETGWSWERKRAGGQPLPHSSHPSTVCCPEKLVRLPTGLQCTRAHLTTPRGSGRCSLTLRAWLQGRREQSVPGRLHPIFINVTSRLVHKCPPPPSQTPEALPWILRLPVAPGVERAGIWALSPTLHSWTRLGYPHSPLWGQVTT